MSELQVSYCKMFCYAFQQMEMENKKVRTKFDYKLDCSIRTTNLIVVLGYNSFQFFVLLYGNFDKYTIRLFSFYILNVCKTSKQLKINSYFIN